MPAENQYSDQTKQNTGKNLTRDASSLVFADDWSRLINELHEAETSLRN